MLIITYSRRYRYSAARPSSEFATRPRRRKPTWLIDAYPRKRVVFAALLAAIAPHSREPAAARATQGSQYSATPAKAVLSMRVKISRTATFTDRRKKAITGEGLPS
jgi:hypothetical protein